MKNAFRLGIPARFDDARDIEPAGRFHIMAMSTGELAERFDMDFGAASDVLTALSEALGWQWPDASAE